MLSTLTTKMKEGGKREIVSAISTSTAFGLAGSGLYDLGNIFDYYGVEGDYYNYITSVNSTSRADATGLSIYFPLYNSGSLDDYIAVSGNQDYNSLLTYFTESSGETLQFTDYATAVDNMLTFTLSADSMEYFAEAEYILFASNDVDGEREDVYLLGNDTDVTVKNNTVTIAFRGVWVEFGGKLLCGIVLNKVGDYTIYQAPIRVDGDDGVLLYWYDAKTHTTDIIGVAFAEDDYGRIYDLDEGDVVTVVKRKYDEGEYVDEYPDDNVFVYSGQNVNMVGLPDGNYQYTAFAKDVHGNTYVAGTAVVKITSGVVEILYVTGDEVSYPDFDYLP
jgi:hypothetical protein